MRTQLVVVILLVLFSACESKKADFSQLNDAVRFRYIQFGEGEQIKENDFIELGLMVTDTIGDTLHYVPNYSYFIKVGNNDLSKAWQHMKVGDSAIFKLKSNFFNQQFKFFESSKSENEQILLYFRVEGVFDSLGVIAQKKKQLWGRREEESKKLQNYLSRSEQNWDTLGGIYRLIEHQNPNGDSIKAGSEVSLDYIGSFLNGYVFEDTKKKKVQPTFIYGKSFQMVEGMEIGIKGLKSGEKVKIILPSRLAFGGIGSLAGIVPPYTTVIYKINIKKVSN